MEISRIVIGSRGSVLAGVVGAVLCLSLHPALAQIPSVGPSGPVGPDYSRPPPEPDTTTTIPDAPTGPTAEELEAERLAKKRQRMLDVNDKGVRNYKAGEYTLAVEVFREALASCEAADDCTIIRKNLENAQYEIDRERAEAQRERNLEASRQAVGVMLDDFASKWGAARRSGPDATGGMVFMGSDQGGDTSAKPSGATTGGLVFMESGESLFSKGTKDSAPVIVSADPDHDRLAGAPFKDNPAAMRDPAIGQAQVAAVRADQLAALAKTAKLAGEPNPRTEVFLDALEVGKGDWAES